MSMRVDTMPMPPPNTLTVYMQAILGSGAIAALLTFLANLPRQKRIDKLSQENTAANLALTEAKAKLDMETAHRTGVLEEKKFEFEVLKETVLALKGHVAGNTSEIADLKEINKTQLAQKAEQDTKIAVLEAKVLELEKQRNDLVIQLGAESIRADNEAAEKIKLISLLAAKEAELEATRAELERQKGADTERQKHDKEHTLKIGPGEGRTLLTIDLPEKIDMPDDAE